MNATATPDDGNSDLRLTLPGRVTPLGSGWGWLAGGWSLFMRAPLMWIISLVVVFICVVAVGFVPIIGQLAVQILQPVILAGWMVACRSLERGGDFELDHLLGGFKKNFGNLCVVGLLFLVGEVAILLIFFAIVVFTVGTTFLFAGEQEILATIMAAGLTFTLGLLICLALFVPLAAAYWFAPVLVIMHDLPPMEAMKASFFACFRNFFPFLVYGILMIPLFILAAIPFGLGFLVAIPMMIASIYVSYREIFTEESAPVPAKPTFA
jgi:hypothetical protein